MSLSVGDSVFAKPSESKLWSLGTVLSIDATSTHATIEWFDGKSQDVLPITEECIQSCSTKRKRKEIVHFDEQEDAYRSAVGMRKKKKKTVSDSNVKAVAAIKSQDRKPSKNILELRNVESLSDRSLKQYLDVLRPFISTKVLDRISSAKSLNENGHVVTSQPPTIKNVVMRDYQIQGLSWLVDHYTRGINAILADEMGLGKTLQTISLMSYITNSLNRSGPHLVVVPLSVLFNWILECRTYCPSLRILRLHSNDSKEQQRLKDILHSLSAGDTGYDVVITTYEMVKGKLETSLRRVFWRTMVLDEGHRIKNDDSNISKSCLLYKARFKLVLTGTPVQNNLKETYSLLRFLHPAVFDLSEGFETAFHFHGNEVQVDQEMLDKAHYLLRPFLLRRVKSEVEQKLPPKLETVIQCPLAPMQVFWSKRLLLKDSAILSELEQPNAGKLASGAWKRLQSLLSQLRKAANHPYLFPGAEDVDPDDPSPEATEEIVTASGKMMMLDRLLPKLFAKGHRVVLFSQYTRTLDIIQDYLHMRGYRHMRLDGSTHRVNREVRICQFNKAGSTIQIFLLSTRAGGEGVNLYTADTVILFDSDWNPQVDIQAMARVHRIGQTKTVHIYRFVSAGTVEERIVQRAQKKLFLDSMVNRGSTSNALELDKLRHQADSEGPTTGDPGTDHADMSTMMEALKFGFSSMFSLGTGTQLNALSDAELDRIIDRKRGLSPLSPISLKTGSSPRKVNRSDDSLLIENQECSAASFQQDLHAPLMSLRSLNGELIPKDEAPTTLKDIAKAWASEGEKSKRARNVRVEMVNVKGVGTVNVLKVNQYSLESGEPSVYNREMKGRMADGWGKEPEKKW